LDHPGLLPSRKSWNTYAQVARRTFPQGTPYHQLTLILDILGTPTMESWTLRPSPPRLRSDDSQTEESDSDEDEASSSLWPQRRKLRSSSRSPMMRAGCFLWMTTRLLPILSPADNLWCGSLSHLVQKRKNRRISPIRTFSRTFRPSASTMRRPLRTSRIPPSTSTRRTEAASSILQDTDRGFFLFDLGYGGF
jgi:hypothetical protein